jgi:hypothetical protein
VYHDPGPRITQSARAIAATVSAPTDGLDQASGRRYLDLSADGRELARAAWVGVAHPGLDVERNLRHRQHSSLGAEQPRDPVESLERAAKQLPQRDDEEVAHRVAVQLAVALESVLQDACPCTAPLVVAAQGGERHPKVTWGQDA